MSLFKFFTTIALLAILPHACYSNAPAPTSDSLAKDLTSPVKSGQQAEEQISTQHQIQLDGQTIPYTATAGNYLLKDEKGDPKGTIFYISYLKDDVTNKTERPITFCFNGGPGSASIWLHMGAFGPRRVFLSDDGLATPPYTTVSNDYSILDLTDLVFIDPVSTGYSRPVAGEDAKQFYGVEEDTKWVAEFIRLYVTRLARWDSPKFVAGESYGGTRAATLSKYLQETINMDLNGVILISPVLDFNTHQSCSNPSDLSFALCVPTLAAAAHYHKKIFLTESFPEIIKQAEEFALGDYSLALLQGSELSQKRFQETAIALSKFSGLPIDYIERAKLRVHYLRFCKELLKSQERTLGRFDSRYLGIDGDHCGSFPEYDPSLDMIIGAFSATFNQYVREDLHWVKDDHYKVLIDLSPWNWGKSTNQSLNVSDDLREAMTRNPDLNVFVASGYYDLATPYFATRYTFNHLGLDPAIRPHLTQITYNAGHMLYTSKPSLADLKKDLEAFYHLTPTLKQQQ
jgi:carboxypeptidase C (cathepsin A)